MNIEVTITQEEHDCVFSQLRKHQGDGDLPDLTVQQWLQDAIDGKINWCQKRANPVSVLTAEKSVLQARILELEALKDLEAE